MRSRTSSIHQPTLFEIPEIAPRLHAFLTYRLSVLSMPKAKWDIAKPPNGRPVLLDLGTTPIQSVDHEPGVHAVTEAVAGIEYRVSIYRPDAQDARLGYPINKDRYTLWDGWPAFLDLGQIVNRASTGLDANVHAGTAMSGCFSSRRGRMLITGSPTTRRSLRF